jgi:hypothetical protein
MDPSGITVESGATITTQVHVNSGEQKAAAYGLTLTFNFLVLSVDTSQGISGVEAGADGFVAAVNAEEPGELKISGMSPADRGRGRICTC